MSFREECGQMKSGGGVETGCSRIRVLDNFMANTTVSPIIWQSDEGHITLIDVPGSISSVQGVRERPCHDLLLSTPAQVEPYKTNEPKSAAARSKLFSNTVDAESHQAYAELLHDAVNTIRAAYDGNWCHPRPFVETREENGPKRKLGGRDEDDLAESENGVGTHRSTCPPIEVSDTGNLLSRLSKETLSMVNGIEPTEGGYSYHFYPAYDGRTRAVLSVDEHGGPDAPHGFFVPPGSSFVLGPCSDVRTLHASIRAQAQELEVSKRFDLILLDPPWPNRSVKRTRKTANSTYSTAQSLGAIHQLIMGMDLDVLMADSCLVAIWITNKPAVRDLVLGENGLFDCWGVELVEEWVWLKTTVHGEPVTPIDPVWRKPYEILLVGRKSRQYVVPTGKLPTRHESVPKRVLASVPDLHSRKPCLKELFETLIHDPRSYRALEVFARYLVAGWWSWGDECIKFNGKQYWQCEEDRSHT
jgi:N6-adenosine-specific RNA methylase IME4